MKERIRYYRKQKALGIALIASGVLVPQIAFLTIPLGIYIFLTKRKVLVNEYFFKDDEDEGSN